ncbi:unnamed protein product, partial [Porites evermanni]
DPTNQVADLTNRVRQLEQQLRMATLNAQQADPGNQGLHVQCQQTIAAVTNQVADLTNGVRHLEQQLRMAMADLTNRQLRMALAHLANRVRQLEEKREEEELASHMKNLNLK